MSASDDDSNDSEYDESMENNAEDNENDVDEYDEEEYIKKKEEILLKELAMLQKNRIRIHNNKVALKRNKIQYSKKQKVQIIAKKRRTGCAVDPQVRDMIRSDLADGERWDRIEKKYQISHGTLANIRKEDTEHPKIRQATGPKSIFSKEENLVLMLDWLEEDPQLTQKDISLKFKDIGENVSPSTVGRHLLQMSVTWKVGLKIPKIWNEPSVIKKRQNFVPEILMKKMDHELIFIDEVGFTIGGTQQRGHGRAVAGVKPVLIVHATKQARLNAICALTSNGILATNYHKATAINSSSHANAKKKRGVTAKIFKHFLVSLREGLRKDGNTKKFLLVLDNASIHHARKLTKTYKRLNDDNIDVLFLPPYSPFLNPIEYVFNVVNESLSKKDLRPETLQQLVENEFASVTKDQSKKFFAHTERFYQQCSEGRPFDGIILPLPNNE